jgi:starch-binding outer membrane protein, SusD/RagB family
MKNKKIFMLLALIPLFSSCDDLFSPAIENYPGLGYMYQNTDYAEGILANAYTRLPNDSWSFNDVSTDDAVSNDKTNNYRLMATGSWTSQNNPVDRWTSCNAAIQYINIFLDNVDKIKWANDKIAAKMYDDRLKGEAFGLRALYMYYLLQAHAGWTTDGKLLGVPLITKPQTTNSDFNQPRATFDDCMKQIYADADSAINLLPIDYGDITSDSQIPAKYSAIGADYNAYNRVFGSIMNLRISARIVKAIRAQVALMAASPAYSSGNTTTWADAANYAGQVLDLIGGVAGMDPNGWHWYSNTSEINGLKSGNNPKEIIWRGSTGTSLSLEQDNFPPTLYGNGRVNPTQNLVNAFSMANGYPISNSNSGYDATNPYSDRDPRLTAYVLVNGGSAGSSSTKIYTAADGTTNDALNKTSTSTRTGYYMLKLMRQDVNLNPNSQNKQTHYQARIRYTEIFLDYAEAANEAWGPTGTGGHSYSAYDVIKAIRQRAGVGTTSGDPYLESVKNDKDAMRTLIHNERRLELCFEGFRFWDLRRWKDPITVTAQGVSITNNIPTVIDVEKRSYSDYMYYGPIPYSEVLKYNQLVQNKGW